MDDIDSVIVYLCYVCHWTFSESCKFIKDTPVKKVRTFIEELQYQKAISDYQAAANSALIICTWANAQKKGNHYRITDFIGQPPQRKNRREKLTKAAEGIIKLPTGGIT